MILKEQVIRMQNLMGIVKEDKAYFDLLNDFKKEGVFFFKKKNESIGYVTFVGMNKPFVAKKGDKVVLVNENDPNEEYEFTYGVDIFQSIYRNNEGYTKKVKNKPEKKNLIQNSYFIRVCIEEAFPESEYTWQIETTGHTKGLRGVYPLSKKDDWSVLNFFDTNPHRKESLYKLFLKSGQSDQKEWLINFFKSDSDELKKLVNQQRNAIDKADKTEIEAMSLITDNYHVSHEKGLKTDRYGGIDATDNDTGETYQIKNIQSVDENVDEDTGEISWEVKGQYSRLQDYRTKMDLDYLAYYIPNKKTVYVFGNQNYKVVSNDLAIHYEEPKIYR